MKVGNRPQTLLQQPTEVGHGWHSCGWCSLKEQGEWRHLGEGRAGEPFRERVSLGKTCPSSLRCVSGASPPPPCLPQRAGTPSQGWPACSCHGLHHPHLPELCARAMASTGSDLRRQGRTNTTFRCCWLFLPMVPMIFWCD